MIKHAFIALAVVLALAFPALAKERDTDTLNIGYASRGALQIEITQPQNLLDIAKGQETQSQNGCGYTFDWGDGSTPKMADNGRFCSIKLTHTYPKAGRYIIEATIEAPKDPRAVDGKLHGKMVVILN